MSHSKKAKEMNPYNSETYELESDIIFNLGDKQEAKRLLDISMKLKYK